MQNALLSVYNKEGIIEFAKELNALGFRIIASPGTAKALKDEKIYCLETTDMGSPSILNHRVVTLHPKFHAGLLAQGGHRDILEDEGYSWINLACVDLYPLNDEIAKSDSTRKDVLEQTDIGGVALLRSAAKGRRIVICDPTDRVRVIEWLKAGKPNRDKFITELAAKAEYVAAKYSLTSASYHGNYSGVIGEQTHECKYGENAHQTPAGLYSTKSDDPLSLDKFKLVNGAPLSYNNWCDVDRLLQTVTHIAAGWDVNFNNIPNIAVAVKHGNPCGASFFGHNPKIALAKMIDGDRRAIFGGAVITNFKIDKEEALTLAAYALEPRVKKRILDIIIAPSFSNEAVKILKRKGGKCRFLVNSALELLNRKSLDTNSRFRYTRGGFLLQPNYTFILDLKDPNIQKFGKVLPWRIPELILAWAIGATSNSNTTTLIHRYLIGNGVGEQDRVSSCQLAIKKAQDAKHNTLDAIAYTDSFFPFEDGPKTLLRAGVKTILAYSGSINDKKIIEYCKKNNITLWLIPDAIGRGFFRH